MRVVLGDVVDFAVGGDDFKGADGGGEVAVFDAGAVGGCSDRSRDSDVGQGGEVVDGEALGVDYRSQGSVADACAYGDGLGLLRSG
jgi:hypothetical protein